MQFVARIPNIIAASTANIATSIPWGGGGGGGTHTEKSLVHNNVNFNTSLLSYQKVLQPNTVYTIIHP